MFTALALMNSPTAHANPEFPNLDEFVDATPEHTIPVTYQVLVAFTAPGELRCHVAIARGGKSATCVGAIPGLGYPANSITATASASSIKPEASPSAVPVGKPLRSGEKVTAGDGAVACGVRDALVACVVNHEVGTPYEQRHGFVISPDSTWTF